MPKLMIYVFDLCGVAQLNKTMQGSINCKREPGNPLSCATGVINQTYSHDSSI